MHEELSFCLSSTVLPLSFLFVVYLTQCTWKKGVTILVPETWIFYELAFPGESHHTKNLNRMYVCVYARVCVYVCMYVARGGWTLGRFQEIVDLFSLFFCKTPEKGLIRRDLLESTKKMNSEYQPQQTRNGQSQSCQLFCIIVSISINESIATIGFIFAKWYEVREDWCTIV